MKKIIFLAVILFAGYKFYQNGFSFSGTPAGAFDKKGNPLVVLFVGPGCGEPCEQVRNALKQRGVVFDEIDIAGNDGAPVANKYGVNRFPVTLIGKREILGNDLMNISATLAEVFGSNVLTGAEKALMAGHFDSQGKAKVVMYGTGWCPYCKQQREFFTANKIRFDDIDVEASQDADQTYRGLKGGGYPLTYVGYRRFDGLKEQEILAAVEELAKAKR
jgi:glutaredoxin